MVYLPIEIENLKNDTSLLKDYQISLYDDTVWMYSNKRFVGWFVTHYDSQYDSIICKDNE